MSILAQVASDWWAPLSQLGFAGAMLYWFTQRAESRMKAMEEGIKVMPEGFRKSIDSLEESVDRMAKAALLQILSYENRESTIRNQAKAMLDDIDKKGNS